MVNALRRVRDALPFYEGVTEIQDASYDAFAAAVERAGRSREDAGFVLSKVLVESDAPDAERLGREIFSSELKRHFPECYYLSADALDGAFERLRSFVKARKNQPIRRAELEETLWSGIPEEVRADKKPVRVFTATEPLDLCSARELVFQWEEFFGGERRSYPAPEAWQRVRRELQATRDWIVKAGRPRRISICGNRRLSTSLCFGSVFSAVSGFALELDYRDRAWRTDEYGGSIYPWMVERVEEGPGGEIAVAIGVLKDIRGDVARFLESEARNMQLRLSLRSSEPLLSPSAANAAVASAKEAISQGLSAAGARALHLFVAAPAPFALFLGHRLNAVGDVQCYEWTNEGSYVPTCRFPT
ncbi:MAG: SAVED domain-containing protein [Candidatus Binatia bacterium]